MKTATAKISKKVINKDEMERRQEEIVRTMPRITHNASLMITEDLIAWIKMNIRAFGADEILLTVKETFEYIYECLKGNAQFGNNQNQLSRDCVAHCLDKMIELAQENKTSRLVIRDISNLAAHIRFDIPWLDLDEARASIMAHEALNAGVV